MPPGLISSAAPGKKAAAPKAAPRRRAAAAGPPPSAAAVSSATPSVAPPTPEPTQQQSQRPVEETAVQENAVRTSESEVQVAKEAAQSETVADNVAPSAPIVPVTAEPVASERQSESENVTPALPTPESTQAQTEQQSEVERRLEEEENRRQEEATRHAELEVISRQQEAREAVRQEEAREAARQEQLAVQARQLAEQQEEARQTETNTAPYFGQSSSSAAPTSIHETRTASTSTSDYVPPSAASAIPATVDPASLPPPPRPDPASKPSAKRTRAEKSTTAAPRPVKKAKTSSTRSNAKVQAAVNNEGEDEDSGVVETTETDSTQPKAKQKRKPATKRAPAGRKRKEISAATIQNSDDEDEGQGGEEAVGEEADTTAQPAPKKQRKPRVKRAIRKKPTKTTAQIADGEAAAEGEPQGEDGEGNEDEEDDGSDPELHEINPKAISMWELSKDEYYGKKSERGKKMEDIDWDKVAQDRRDAANALVASLRTDVPTQAESAADVVPSVEGPNGTAEPEGSQGRRSQSRAPTTTAAEPTPAPVNDDLGLGFVLDADGNIVADENTLTFTRDAAAQAAANSDAPVEEFTDLTQNINRFTHLNNNRRDPADRLPVWKSKSDPWSEDETDKFYDALRMFGTDFFIISKMFAPKTRRMIKNKFTREEKLDPKRITRALTGVVETPMSLEHYSRETGFAMERFTKFEGVEHAQSVIDNENAGKEVVDEREAKRREKELAKEEKEREKEREKEERKARRKAKTKKGMAAAGGGFGGGGPIEDVVGDAE